MQSVLIAEDDRSACEGLGEVLTTAGFSVALAHDGEEALDRLKERAFDVVLLDVWMPRMNGLQLLTQMRTHAACPKVIVMTADDTPETVLLTLRAHADHFLPKPIRIDALLEVLRSTASAPPDMPSVVVLSARPGWVELLVPCVAEIADRVPAFIMRLESALPEKVRASLVMIFRELLLDAMERNGSFDSNRKLRLAYLRTRHMLLYRLADAGFGFRAGDLPQREAAPLPQERRRRPGAPTDFRIRPGLELARAEADELLVNEERDEFVFVKYLD
jgi:DNA-binding response OmpR family regulator